MTTLLATLMFALQPHDRILFYGDSITEQRLYTTYVEAFVRTRYPNLDCEFGTFGVGGDATWGGWAGSSEERVKRDVAPWHPTRVVIMLGMNDGGYVPFSADIDKTFAEWYGKLIGWMKTAAPDAKFTLVQTSPFDDFSGQSSPYAGYNASLVKYGRHVSELASQRGFEFVDFNQPVADSVLAARKANPEEARRFLPDTIHPSPAGHIVMASALLKSWGAGGLVSKVKIDATAKTAQADNASVSQVDGLAWTVKEASLPFPLDDETRLGAKFSGFQQDLNREELQVAGLSEGKYALAVDGEKPVGIWDSADLASGINLSDLDTPMRRQAAHVLDLANKRNEVEHSAWLGIGHVMGGFKTTPAAVKSLHALADEIGSAEKGAAQTVPHHFKLTKVG